MDFPSTTLAAGTSDTSDKVVFSYDANGNRTSVTKRDGTSVITFCYDALNREIQKYPRTSGGGVACNSTGTAVDVFTGYDLAGRPTSRPLHEPHWVGRGLRLRHCRKGDFGRPQRSPAGLRR